MSSNKVLFRKIILILGALLACFLISIIIFYGTSNETKKLPKIGFVLNGSIDDTGWNEMNYNGMLSACEKYNCKLIVKENILENTGQCKKAVSELIEAGVSIIVLSSSYYTAEVKDLILKNKKILFYSNYSDFDAPNLSTYFVRMYQARYLTGIIAGLVTKTNQIGYVAAYNTTEVNRGISAFTMGVKRVNKNARVIVKWTNDWDNEDKEKEAVKELAENTKIDVISYHQNQPFVVQEAEKYGIYSFGYHVDQGFRTNCLTSIVCDWAAVYDNILKNGLYNQSYHDDYYWLGMDDNALFLTPISDLVDNNIKIKIESIKNQLFYGFNIFSGLIYDNQGNIRCSEDEILSDKSLLEKFDWLIEGVEIYGK